MYVWQLCVIIIVLDLVHIFYFVFIITISPGLKILCMNFVSTVVSVHVVIIPSMTGFQTGKSLTVYAATVLFLILQADAIDKQQTLSDNFKVRHPVLFLYN